MKARTNVVITNGKGRGMWADNVIESVAEIFEEAQALGHFRRWADHPNDRFIIGKLVRPISLWKPRKGPKPSVTRRAAYLVREAARLKAYRATETFRAKRRLAIIDRRKNDESWTKKVLFLARASYARRKALGKLRSR